MTSSFELGRVWTAIGEVDDTTPCHDCGQTYYFNIGSYWLADDALWQEVVGDGQFALCPGCFAERATVKSIPMHWRAVRE